MLKRIVAIVLVLLGLMAAVGVILPTIYRAREEEEMRRCQNNLRQIAAFGMVHSSLPGEPVPSAALTFLPTGTVKNPAILPDKRMSWYLLILQAVDQGPIEPGAPKKTLAYADLTNGIDLSQPWDGDAQKKMAHTRLNFAVCPAQRLDFGNGPALTSYLGNGGIGSNTPTLTVEEAGLVAGALRYDSITPLEIIRDADGLSHTLLVGESALDIGPWLQGGPATVRTLNAGMEPPYLGKGRLYAGCHRGRGNFAAVDGSVRVLTDRINPAVFKSTLTIQGHETEAEFHKD